MIGPELTQRTFHGPVTPEGLARALVGELARGSLQAQQLGSGDHVVVQIATRPGAPSGGPTAVTVQLHSVEDGVMIEIGKQAWHGVAASLAETALWALRNPWTLITRLDDVAEDLSSFGLVERVWKALEAAAAGVGASHQISERLRRLVCAYCATANVVGAPSCEACGAPLGPEQPIACPRCGFVSPAGTAICPRCGTRLS